MPRVVLLLALLAACAPPDPLVLLDPDGTRDGLDGRDGPLGVARAVVPVPGRARADLVFPAEPDGRVRAGPHPVLVLVQDEGVVPDAYEPLAVHLASRGVAVLLPTHPFGRPRLAPASADHALEALRRRARERGPLWQATSREASVAFGGEGVGGEVAAERWLASDHEALVLFASAPHLGDADPRPVLALVGADDPRVAPGDIAAAVADHAGPAFVGVVEGGDPFAWTEPSVEALRVVDAFLDHVLVERRPEPFGGDFPGVTAP